MQRILIAVRDPVVRKLAIQTLADLDVQIDEAASPEEAAVALEGTPPELALLGEDFLSDTASAHALLSDDRFADTAMIVLGKAGDDAARLALIEAGAADFIIQPFSPREFRVRILSHLRTRTRFRRRLQELLRQADRSRAKVIESFSLGVAHNVNNLLTALMGHASLAKSYAVNDNAICHLDAASNCAQRMCELAQQLLAFAGDIKHAAKVQSLTAIVRWGVAIFDHVALKHRVILRCSLSEDRLLARCDEFELTTVLLQILNNAREAMPDGGMIRVRAYADGEMGVIEISDTGKGMSADMVANAKNPFVTTKMTVGVGLGLSMSQGIIQGFGGTLDIASTEGSGTTVAIRLPLADRGVEEAQEPDRVAPLILSDCTVALVIDSTDSRGIFGALLERIGVRVICLDDVRSLLLEIGAARIRIRAAVIDLSMAIETARVAVTKIRALYPQLPIVCLGVQANDLPDEDDSTHCLIKPFPPDRLIESLAGFGDRLFS